MVLIEPINHIKSLGEQASCFTDLNAPNVTAAVIALSFIALTLEPTSSDAYHRVIIIVAFYLFVLILICECFHMDAFRDVFNMLMSLDECRDNYRVAELIYNKLSKSLTKVPYSILSFKKTDFFNMIVSDSKDEDRQRLLRKISRCYCLCDCKLTCKF